MHVLYKSAQFVYKQRVPFGVVLNKHLNGFRWGWRFFLFFVLFPPDVLNWVSGADAMQQRTKKENPKKTRKNSTFYIIRSRHSRCPSAFNVRGKNFYWMDDGFFERRGAITNRRGETIEGKSRPTNWRCLGAEGAHSRWPRERKRGREKQREREGETRLRISFIIERSRSRATLTIETARSQAKLLKESLG